MQQCGMQSFRNLPQILVAQCSATPATVAATPPCSATPFQTQISVRQLPGQGGGRCDTKIFRGCSATPVLHLQNAIKSKKSAATRVARQGVPAIVCSHPATFPKFKGPAVPKTGSNLAVSSKRCSRKRRRQQQECVRNASKMRHNESCFIGKRGTFQNASKMRGTPLGENTFWTTPNLSWWAGLAPKS